MNTPNQAAWFERYLTDWTGPYGRLGRVTFRMRGVGVPRGHHGAGGHASTGSAVDEVGCGWVSLSIALSVDDDVKTTCTARVAVPVERGGQPVAPAWRTVAP